MVKGSELHKAILRGPPHKLHKLVSEVAVDVARGGIRGSVSNQR